jgi:hypothetical protein
VVANRLTEDGHSMLGPPDPASGVQFD